MSNGIGKIAFGIVLVLMLVDSADAQQAWSNQNPSQCSDQYGAFDAYVPGMRGHGSCNRGGFVPGTNVHVVTNRNASGSGSLASAIAASCPKVILFGVSGLIHLGGDDLEANRCDNWSVVGASAPGNVTITGSTNETFLTQGSNWTIDHLTIAAGDNGIVGGGTGNRDALAFGTGQVQEDTGIVLNSNVIWGADEGVQCYPPVGGEREYILYWQTLMGLPVGQRLTHIIQTTCDYHATIRSMYVHSHGRMPLVRGHGYFHANNFAANPGFQTSLIQPCGQSSADSVTQMNFIGNLTVRGPQSDNHRPLLAQDASCTTLEVYESGNALMNNDNSIENCANHNCAGGFNGDDLKNSVITAVYPTGYVPEPINSTPAGILEFANKITTFVGARPLDRLPYIQANIGEAINMVDGSGSEGIQSIDTITEGGLAIITPLSASYDPTSGGDNACGESMPTGSTADAIQSSGLTRLHEWVIGCFYDNVMPAGYRADLLENYGAPGGGGGVNPPPAPEPRPNPPSGLQIP